MCLGPNFFVFSKLILLFEFYLDIFLKIKCIYRFGDIWVEKV